MPKPFWLILLYLNVTCTALYLENFADSSNDWLKVNVVAQGDISSYRRLYGLNNEEAVEKCAGECFLAQYVCNSFAVIQEYNYRTCVKVSTSLSGLRLIPSTMSNVVVGVYNIHKLRKFNVGTEFSSDIGKKSGRQWVDGILQGYGLPSSDALGRSNSFFVPFLLGCRSSVMYGQPPKGVAKMATLENDILSVHGPEGQIRKHRKISQESTLERTTLSTGGIITSLDSWTDPSKINPSSDPSSEHFDTIVLEFLDIFSRNIRQGITTTYDPAKKCLFVEGMDLHLLIVSLGSGEYIIVRDGPAKNGIEHVPYIYSIYDPKISTLGQHFPEELSIFKGALRSSGHTTDYLNPRVFHIEIQDVKMSAIDLVFKVAMIVMTPTDYTIPNFLPASRPLIRDLVAFVLLAVYGENRQSNPFQTRLSIARSQRQFKTDMVTIITTPSIVEDV